jgi:hypothetical protein
MGLLRDFVSGFFALRTVAAPEVRAGSATITPLMRVAALSFGGTGLVRIRPSGVLVSDEGRVSCIPIRDVTRLAQAGIVVLTVLCAYGLLLRAASRERRRRHEPRCQ